MNKIKIYECAICLRLSDKGVKGENRFRGTRKSVRKHLVELHHIKGRKNKQGVNTKEFGRSKITENIISEELK